MQEDYFKRGVISLILIALMVLAFILIKPLLIAIILGLLLAFIFSPVYTFTQKHIKNENVSATLITVLLILLIVIPLWFLLPILVKESLKIYLSVQNLDFVTPLKSLFPNLFSSEAFSNEIASALESFVSNLTRFVLDYFANFILNFPTLLLQLLVVMFVFYFALRDKEKIIDYLKSVLPFPPYIEKKLFDSSRDITKAVLYGQVVIGFAQGVIVGTAFFLFGVPSAFLLTLLAIFAGVFPIIGTMIIWAPVVAYLLAIGNTFAAIGIIVFGIISSNLDNFLRPLFVSKRTDIHPSIVLIGMIGGLFLFGIMGVFIGPLILAYLLIVLELFRNKRASSDLLN